MADVRDLQIELNTVVIDRFAEAIADLSPLLQAAFLNAYLGKVSAELDDLPTPRAYQLLSGICQALNDRSYATMRLLCAGREA